MLRSFALTITLLCPAAYGATANGLGQLHTFGDWVVGCDNTLTCEAQGYGSNADDALGDMAALIVRREGGPRRLPVLSFAYGSIDDKAVRPDIGEVVTVQVDALQFRLPAAKKDESETTVPPAQVSALLAAALTADHVLLTAGSKRWAVSLSGAAAALLKMDDLQRRVGTASALVRHGSKPETDQPIASQPQPARLPPTTASDLKRERKLLAALPTGEACPDYDPELVQGNLVRLSSTSVLVAQACYRGAYQTGSRLWQVDVRGPLRARPVLLPQPSGGASDTLVIEEMSGKDGALSLQESAKVRGIGDCWAIRQWTWTGAELALISASESACKLFEAGGLPIQLWRTNSKR